MAKVFHDERAQRVDFLDDRYYRGENKWVPSVNTILDVIPKGEGFRRWLMSVGLNADTILQQAAQRGSRVHAATETIDKGGNINWKDGDGKAAFTREEWMMILRHAEFRQRFRPRIVAIEARLIDEDLGYAGTLDRVYELDVLDGLVLTDIKTSVDIYDTAELQCAAYAMLWNKRNPHLPIKHIAVLHLNAKTKTEGKAGTIQGEGWRLEVFKTPYEQSFEVFKHAQALWHWKNPNAKPLCYVYPDSVNAAALNSSDALPITDDAPLFAEQKQADIDATVATQPRTRKVAKKVTSKKVAKRITANESKR